jgi:hypothetical protein
MLYTNYIHCAWEVEARNANGTCSKSPDVGSPPFYREIEINVGS